MRQAEERKKNFFSLQKYKREREAKRVRERYVTATAGDGVQEREGYYTLGVFFLQLALNATLMEK